MKLSRAIILLGVVSLLMDVASEMLYPIGPIYLTVVLGASVAWVGVIEGIAEAVSGLSKGYFGSLSDAFGRRRPFVTLGYAVSALSKPLPALFPSVAGVLGSRTLDRVGKGVRTAPRDALLAGYVDSGSRGAAFGFHRAMDTTGAAIGPVIALIYLTFRPGDYRTLFLLAFVPSALAAVATLLIREERFVPSAARPSLRQLLFFWRQAPAAYRRIIVWLTLFSIANASDVFLILRARGVGVDERWAIGAYILYNFVYAATAYPGGKLSDRIGRKRVMVAGLFLYALVYAGFAAAEREWAIWCLFPLYGVYAACTEGISKAWVSDLVPNEHRGLAIGLYTMLSSLGMLVASSWTGVLWSDLGPAAPLLIAAVTAAIVAFGLLSVPSMLSPGRATDV